MTEFTMLAFEPVGDGDTPGDAEVTQYQCATSAGTYRVYRDGNRWAGRFDAEPPVHLGSAWELERMFTVASEHAWHGLRFSTGSPGYNTWYEWWGRGWFTHPTPEDTGIDYRISELPDHSFRVSVRRERHLFADYDAAQEWAQADWARRDRDQSAAQSGGSI